MRILRKVLWFLVFLAAGVCGYLYWQKTQVANAAKEQLPAETAPIRDASVFAVTASPVTTREVQRKVEVVGTLHGFEEVTISAKNEGRVKRLLRDIADRVKPGELLIEIDPTDFELSLRQAEKSLEVELAKLGVKEPPGPNFDVTALPPVKQAAARLENSKLKLARVQEAGVAISKEDLADKQADFRIAESEYQNQIFQMKSNWATLQMKWEAASIAKQQLLDTKIIAPTPSVAIPNSTQETSYVITHRPVAEGSFVRVGTELCKLAMDQTLKLRVPVPERYTSVVRLNMEVAVFSVAYPHAFQGLVTRINPSIDSANRTFEVEVQVPNSDGKLRPGGFAKAHLLHKRDQGAITVPVTSLVNFAGITKIFLIEEGKAKEITVTTGEQSTEWVEITSPELPKNAQVITSGQTAIANGSKVEVRQKR